MINCFGPARIKSVGGWGHQIYYILVRSRSGQKITGHYGVRVPKTLSRRTLLRICFVRKKKWQTLWNVPCLLYSCVCANFGKERTKIQSCVFKVILFSENSKKKKKKEEDISAFLMSLCQLCFRKMKKKLQENHLIIIFLESKHVII